jgi:hypothetical protein
MVIFTKKDTFSNKENNDIIDNHSDGSDDDIDILDDICHDSEVASNCWNWSNYLQKLNEIIK